MEAIKKQRTPKRGVKTVSGRREPKAYGELMQTKRLLNAALRVWALKNPHAAF